VSAVSPSARSLVVGFSVDLETSRNLLPALLIGGTVLGGTDKLDGVHDRDRTHESACHQRGVGWRAEHIVRRSSLWFGSSRLLEHLRHATCVLKLWTGERTHHQTERQREHRDYSGRVVFILAAESVPL
jgi:hypothetical protein